MQLDPKPTTPEERARIAWDAILKVMGGTPFGAASTEIIATAIRDAESAVYERIAAHLDRMAATGRTIARDVSPKDADAYTAALMHFPLGVSILPQFEGMASLVRALPTEETPHAP